MKNFISNIGSAIDDFNENIHYGLSEFPAELTIAAIGAISLSGVLFCPLPVVAIGCALTMLMVVVGLVKIGNSHNYRKEWLEAAMEGRRISDRHGNIMLDEYVTGLVIDSNVLINGKLVVNDPLGVQKQDKIVPAAEDDSQLVNDQFPLAPSSR